MEPQAIFRCRSGSYVNCITFFFKELEVPINRQANFGACKSLLAL